MPATKPEPSKSDCVMAAASYDINTELTIVLGGLELALMGLSAIHPMRVHLLEARKATVASAAKVQLMLTYSTSRGVTPSAASLESLVA